jgi:glycosyltransferase involved in cell wall biosynthesis
MELGSFYKNSRAFAFLSEYEGFGLTPLEAISAGVPPVVLDTPVAQEAYRDAALYIPSPDPLVVAEALEQIMFNEELRTRLLNAAANVVSRYSWTDCAAMVLRAIESTESH